MIIEGGTMMMCREHDDQQRMVMLISELSFFYCLRNPLVTVEPLHSPAKKNKMTKVAWLKALKFGILLIENMLKF